jgi:DNA-binding LacI/PurR family transcriptional regulator
MPAPSRPFYADAVAAAARALQVDGKRLMVVEADGADPNGAIADVLSYAVDGVILVSAIPAPAMLDLCRREARPIVVFNRQTAIEGLSYVACDDEAAGRAAAALLAGRHRCPAFLGGTRDSATHRDRLAGFRTGLRAEGLPAPAMALGGWRYDRAFAAASRLLGSTAPPDAIFCANDVMACAAVDAARRARLAVPRDLSVIGFDDSIGADWDAYRLTTFRVPLARMVAAALEALSLPPGAPPLRLRLPAELVERGSVRA